MRRALLVLAVAVVTGCVAPSRDLKLSLNAHLARGDYDAAAHAIEAARNSQYGASQAVLYYLDKGSVLHSARRYQESDQLLDAAELKMEELYTKSVSRTAGSFIVNDNATEYPGEPHERALLHVMRALNHVFIANHEGALVEARKVSLFLQELNDRGVKGVYRDDAFAQYLAAMLFEDDGRADDARICRERARAAYDWYAREYGTPIPPLEFTPRSPQDGELVVIHYNGPAPRKESRQLQVAWNEAVVLVKENGESRDAKVENAMTAALSGNALTISYPVFVSDPRRVDAALVSVAGVTERTHLAEDVSAIARSSLEQKLPAIKAKSLARAMVKHVAGEVAKEAARRAGGDGLAFLTGLVARGAAAATETADTRWWSTVPAEFRIARLSVPPGVHAVDVSYVDAAGNVVSTETLQGVEVVANARTYVHVRSVF